MARKVNIKVPDIQDALDEWKLMTETRYEIAMEAYEYQDDETKKVLDRIVIRLRMGANGMIRVRVNPPHGGTVPVQVEQEWLDMNLLYVATEILKDLALFDIKVGTYQFPPSLCVSCGTQIVVEKSKRRRNG